MQRLVIRNTQSPGDILVLSAAIRDLHIAHPKLYEIAVNVSPGAEHIFWYNTDVAAIRNGRLVPGEKQFVAQYPLIHSCNQQRKHFLWGFIEFMNAKFGTRVKLTDFRPKIVMSSDELTRRPFEKPYWVFLSGGKKDFPAKIWDQSWWQQLITMTSSDINWVQCGGGSANHIKHVIKNGVYANMVGKTTCRELINLIYHSEGVVCGVTFAMHIAAALNKPCVVIAGGREPWWWEAYTDENRLVNMRVGNPKWVPPDNDPFVPHRFLHTVGQLDCCQGRGCWKARVVGTGSVCAHPVSQNGDVIPRCLSMITPQQVAEAIYSYKDMSAPALPPVVAVEVAATPKLVYCVNGSDRWLSLLPFKHSAIRVSGSRADALKAATASGEWIVWLEEGNGLVPGWDSWLHQLRQPGIYGRVHRSQADGFYPYPGSFVVHRSLLADKPGFRAMFAGIPPEQYRQIGAFVTLSTRPVPMP